MRGDRWNSAPLLGGAGALIALACCAGLPLIGTIIGGLTAAAVIGVAGGALVSLFAVAGAIALTRMRRRGCEHQTSKVEP